MSRYDRKRWKNRCSVAVLFAFLVYSVYPLPLARAQLVGSGVNSLPPPGVMVSLSEGYTPPLIRGLTVDPQNALQFNFIVYNGDESLEGEAFKEESLKLVKYFLAALTVPEEEMWVNLSPYERGRIISDSLGRTDMGKGLLAQDYLLKQLTASLMYPEKELGAAFWQRVYEEAYTRFGTTEIPVQTFHKVWIVPDKAVVYERNGTAVIVDQRLKVMAEEDYMAMRYHSVGAASRSRPDIKEPMNNERAQGPASTDIATNIIRQIILPAIEKEVNEGRNFAPLRQIYHSMILASWYKKALKDSLLGRVYANKGKVKGVELLDKEAKQRIYERYLEAFRKGVYNYIKEDRDPRSEAVIPRKYFSGGLAMRASSVLEVHREDLNRQGVRQTLFARAVRRVVEGMKGKHYKKVTIEALSLGPKAEETSRIEEALRPVTASSSVVETAEVSFPRPPIKKDSSGRIYPSWRMVNGLLEILWEQGLNGQSEIVLTKKYKRRLADLFEDRFGFDNIENGSGIKIDDMFQYLVKLGFLGQKGSTFFLLMERKYDMDIWTRNNVLMERELNRLFDQEGRLDEQGLEEVIADYSEAARRNSKSLVEPYQTFLRGILGIDSTRRRAIVDYLKRKYFTGKDAPYTGGILVDSLLLMLNEIEDLPRWAGTVFSTLKRDGRTVYLVAPEITLLAGGLGRVMQYLGRALKHMGVNVVFIEPRYLKKITVNEEQELDYASLPIPLDIQEEPAFSFYIYVQGKEVLVDVYETLNDEGIPVYTFQDRAGFYTQGLYRHNGEKDGRYPSQASLVEFISKASREVQIRLDTENKKEAERQGKPWVPSLYAANDGQVLLSTILHLYDPAFQGDVSLETHLAATNHTVLNTIQLTQEALTGAGVPEDFLWLFKRLRPWWSSQPGEDQVYDVTKAGILGAQISKGFANSVSETHADDMRRWFTENFGPLYGLTNGDLISLTMRPFGLKFIELYGTAKQKTELERLQADLAKAGKFEKAVRQRAIDNFLYHVVWAYVDRPGRTEAELKEMLLNVKYHLKKQYIREYIIPRQQELGIVIPESYKGKEDVFWETFARKVWLGYSGRWVGEKSGRQRAFTDENLAEMVEDYDTVPLILGNPQYYEGTENPGGSLYEANRALDLARDLNKGETEAKFIFRKGFDLPEQLLFLMATDGVIMDSDSLEEGGVIVRTEASGATETHALGLNIGPAEWHGFIQGIGTPLDLQARRGTTLVPQNADPASYAKIYRLIADLHKKGELGDYLLDALKMFRSVDTTLTAFAYARGWNQAIEEAEAFGASLAKEKGTSVPEALREYYQGFARKEREVSIEDVGAMAETRDGLRRYAVEHRADGRAVVYFQRDEVKGRRLTLSVRVNPHGINPDVVHVIWEDQQKRQFKDEAGGVVRKRVDEAGMIVFEMDVDLNTITKGGDQYTVFASGGMWYEIQEIVLRADMPSTERDIIHQQTHQRFSIRIMTPGVEQKGRAVLRRGGQVELEVTVPLKDRKWVSQLALRPYTNTKDGLWRFLRPAEYSISPRPLVEEGKVSWIIKYSPEKTGDLTFALFDKMDEVSEDAAISWANNEGDNLKMDVLPGRLLKREVSRGASSSVTPGGIDLNPAILDLQIRRDARGIPLPVSDQPLDEMQVEGFLPVILRVTPVGNLPLLLGLVDEQEPGVEEAKLSLQNHSEPFPGPS